MEEVTGRNVHLFWFTVDCLWNHRKTRELFATATKKTFSAFRLGNPGTSLRRPLAAPALAGRGSPTHCPQAEPPVLGARAKPSRVGTPEVMVLSPPFSTHHLKMVQCDCLEGKQIGPPAGWLF